MSEQTIPTWTLGWRLKRSLDWANLSAQAMADEFGVDRGTISRWMSDRSPVRDIYLRVWAEKCGVPVDWLRNGGGTLTDAPTGQGVRTRRR